MIINALNSGANVFMADFEDSTTPTWDNLLDGQINLRDAVRRTITFADPATAKQYKLNDKPAVLFVRPRGWHLDEKHVLVDGEPMSGSLFDFGLYFFHNAKRAARRAAPAPTSICPRWRATSKRASGTTSSSARRTSSASRAAPSAPPC